MEIERNTMKEKKSFFKSTGEKVLLVVFIVFCGFLIRGRLDGVYEEMQAEVKEDETTERVGRELDYAENVPEDNKILQAFKTQYPGAEVLVACEEDLTNDTCEDLVVICRLPDDKSHVHLIVAVDSGDGENYQFTEPILAPVENQKITFKNIDEKDEMEFVLQGQKGNKVGYGIFRVIDGTPVNLFGEGMEDC